MNIFIFFYIGCAIFTVVFVLGAKSLLDHEKKESKKDSSYHFYA